jgi:hypothetical protein
MEREGQSNLDYRNRRESPMMAHPPPGACRGDHDGIKVKARLRKAPGLLLAPYR